MEDELFCILCTGKLTEEELPVGFCLHCQIVLYRDLVQEAEQHMRQGSEAN